MRRAKKLTMTEQDLGFWQSTGVLRDAFFIPHELTSEHFHTAVQPQIKRTNNFMAKRSWNALTLRSELETIESVLTPHIEKAKLLTASIDGKSVPISDAPIADRLKALMAVNPVGEDRQRDTDLTVTNADIAARLETAESNLSVANGTMGGLQKTIRDLEARATTAEITVQKMTAERSQIDLQLKSSQTEYARVCGEQATVNAEISRRALAIGCLSDLRDPATKELLSSKATGDERQKSAEMVPVADKISAIFGALHSAASNIGVPLGAKPSEQPGQQHAKPMGVDARIRAIKAGQKL